MADSNIKAYPAEICRICQKLWPNEWEGKYTGSQADFKVWLNSKTNLNENHLNYDGRESALKAWMDALLALEAQE